MTIKNSGRNISAEPGDIVLDVTSNTLTKQDNNSNFANNLILTIKQQDFINEANQSHTKTLTIPMSEVVRLAYLQNNYYDKTQSDTRYNVTVESQAPESGYSASYIVKQNGKQVGAKINIPKDLLLRSAELKTVGTTPTTEEAQAGLKAKQKYILFIVNTKDNDNATRLLLSVNDLVDVYTADEQTLTVSNNQFKVKDGGITNAKLATALQTTINNKVDKVTGKGLSTNDYTNTDKNLVATIKDKATTEYVDSQILSILDPSGEIRLDIASKADAEHSHGNITHNGKISNATLSSVKGILVTDSSEKIFAVPTIKKSQISDFTHTHPTTEITEASALGNIGTAANANQHAINDKINTAIGKKVDKVTGKGLSTNDFDDTLLNKLNHIAEEANKYVHPTQNGAPFMGFPATSLFPKFGDGIALSQVETDKYGHVSRLIDRDIIIPGTLASNEEPGLMSKNDYIKLYNIEKQATKTTASTTSPKMNGTVAVGSELTTFARGDHVHPIDTSRAPNNHASSANTYGLSTEALYGHAKPSQTTPKPLGASGSLGTELSTFARGDHVHPLPPNATINNNGLMTTAYVNIITGLQEKVAALEAKTGRNDTRLLLLRKRQDGTFDGENGTQLVVNRGTDSIYAKLVCDDPNYNVSGKTVRIYINNTAYTYTTGSNGLTTSGKLIELGSGQYLITGIVAGDNEKHQTSTQKVLVVQ